MAVRVTDDGMGHIWVTNTLEPDKILRFSKQDWDAFIAKVRAGVDCPEP